MASKDTESDISSNIVYVTQPYISGMSFNKKSYKIRRFYIITSDIDIDYITFFINVPVKKGTPEPSVISSQDHSSYNGPGTVIGSNSKSFSTMGTLPVSSDYTTSTLIVPVIYSCSLDELRGVFDVFRFFHTKFPAGKNVTITYSLAPTEIVDDRFYSEGEKVLFGQVCNSVSITGNVNNSKVPDSCAFIARVTVGEGDQMEIISEETESRSREGFWRFFQTIYHRDIQLKINQRVKPDGGIEFQEAEVKIISRNQKN